MHSGQRRSGDRSPATLTTRQASTSSAVPAIATMVSAPEGVAAMVPPSSGLIGVSSEAVITSAAAPSARVIGTFGQAASNS